MNLAVEQAPNERSREHLKLIGDMTMGRVPPSQRKAELKMTEDAMRSNTRLAIRMIGLSGVVPTILLLKPETGAGDSYFIVQCDGTAVMWWTSAVQALLRLPSEAVERATLMRTGTSPHSWTKNIRLHESDKACALNRLGQGGTHDSCDRSVFHSYDRIRS